LPSRGIDVTTGSRESTAAPAERIRPAIELSHVSRRFGTNVALDGVSLSVAEGTLHALLGPNGAGKTTLLRILTGLVTPHAGEVRVRGVDPQGGSRSLRQRVGLVPSGDRTFYLRLSAFENLLFFARLHGLRKRSARSRAREVLEAVDLADVSRRRVGLLSHGMQKRLSVARALLTEPDVLLVDEATHDLDPDAAQRVRDLVRSAAAGGAAVIWTTQRIDEVRGFADEVTLLAEGQVRFFGTVPDLLSHALTRRYLLRVATAGDGLPSLAQLQQALGSRGEASAVGSMDSGYVLLSLEDEVVLGDAVAVLAAAEIKVLACTEERSEVEVAFRALTGTKA
jgi:ABC-2 type transport system ATP-binding protein